MSDNGNNGSNGIPDRLLARPLVIKPRRTGYTHRDFIAIDDHGIGHLETGDTVANLPVFTVTAPAHVWLSTDPSILLACLDMHLGHSPHWHYQLTESQTGQASRTRLARFGMRKTYFEEHGLGKKSCLHQLWDPADMLPSTDFMGPLTPANMLRFATDVRAWLQAHDLPIPASLTGIGKALLRDPRFYPDARARVPSATNERLRKYLPGVHQELRGRHFGARDVTALDQAGAYHRIAQEVPLPDAETLYARGHFDDAATAPVWLHPGQIGFQETIGKPGIICAEVISRFNHRTEFRPPAVNFAGKDRIYLWTNEVPFLQAHGVQILGVIAAWVSDATDEGLPRYGKWALAEITRASTYRKGWLKSTLHTTYGLLGAKPRTLRIGRRIGRGEPTKWLLGIRQFFVRESELEHKPVLSNVAQLGTLQAEVRLRSMDMANALQAHGATVTHIHADGLHVIGDIPLLDSSWRIEERTNLTYIDRVSWTSDQGDILPGREAKQRVEARNHHAHVLRNASERAKTR